MFQVFEGRVLSTDPADQEEWPADAWHWGLPFGTGWDNSKFETLNEANLYALTWLGPWGDKDLYLHVGVPYRYCDDSFVVIKEV